MCAPISCEWMGTSARPPQSSARCTAQAPPNLTPVEAGADATQSLQDSWTALLDAGINDWGGLSPLTRGRSLAWSTLCFHTCVRLLSHRVRSIVVR